jgi:hypothetical protein
MIVSKRRPRINYEIWEDLLLWDMMHAEVTGSLAGKPVDHYLSPGRMHEIFGRHWMIWSRLFDSNEEQGYIERVRRRKTINEVTRWVPEMYHCVNGRWSPQFRLTAAGRRHVRTHLITLQNLGNEFTDRGRVMDPLLYRYGFLTQDQEYEMMLDKLTKEAISSIVQDRFHEEFETWKMKQTNS